MTEQVSAEVLGDISNPLACPFCTGEAFVWGSWLYSSQGPFSGHVHCNTPDCGLGPAGRGATIEEAAQAAIAAWNKRPAAETTSEHR